MLVQPKRSGKLNFFAQISLWGKWSQWARLINRNNDPAKQHKLHLIFSISVLLLTDFLFNYFFGTVQMTCWGQQRALALPSLLQINQTKKNITWPKISRSCLKLDAPPSSFSVAWRQVTFQYRRRLSCCFSKISWLKTNKFKHFDSCSYGSILCLRFESGNLDLHRLRRRRNKAFALPSTW